MNGIQSENQALARSRWFQFVTTCRLHRLLLKQNPEGFDSLVPADSGQPGN